MGLGHCCHSLNNYNPFNSSILFCVDLQVRTSVQCWFCSQCHHNFASSFALDNHFLSQELHISQCSTTQTHVEHPRTCTLSLGFPGSSLSSKCVPWIAPLGSHLWCQHQMLWLWRAADVEPTSTTAWAAAQSSTSSTSAVFAFKASKWHDFGLWFLYVDWAVLD